jgi:hypothetical protein
MNRLEGRIALVTGGNSASDDSNYVTGAVGALV